MDLNSLKDQVSNLTLYDLKAGFRKAQNAVMNYTEMEAKVREATNNEPWGASSTMLQEIANGTFNYQLLNEIMPMIYKRFTEGLGRMETDLQGPATPRIPDQERFRTSH